MRGNLWRERVKPNAMLNSGSCDEESYTSQPLSEHHIQDSLISFIVIRSCFVDEVVDEVCKNSHLFYF